MKDQIGRVISTRIHPEKMIFHGVGKRYKRPVELFFKIRENTPGIFEGKSFYERVFREIDFVIPVREAVF